jgi:hypothetical protein
MKIKTAELTGPALDWAVAKCHGKGLDLDDPDFPWLTSDGIADVPLEDYSPSTDWQEGGPIIEREEINLRYYGFDRVPYWTALSNHKHFPKKFGALGPTPLIAAMRCYISSRLGDEVDIPEELL